jgi:hypothetical protein
MAILRVSLHSITKDIEKAVQQLRAIRKKVSPQDRKQIDLDIRGLQAAEKSVKHICFQGGHGRVFHSSKKR